MLNCTGDPLENYLKTFGFSVVLLPREGIRPLQVATMKASRRLQTLGDLVDLFEGVPPPAPALPKAQQRSSARRRPAPAALARPTPPNLPPPPRPQRRGAAAAASTTAPSASTERRSSAWCAVRRERMSGCITPPTSATLAGERIQQD